MSISGRRPRNRWRANCGRAARRLSSYRVIRASSTRPGFTVRPCCRSPLARRILLPCSASAWPQAEGRPSGRIAIRRRLGRYTSSPSAPSCCQSQSEAPFSLTPIFAAGADQREEGLVSRRYNKHGRGSGAFAFFQGLVPYSTARRSRDPHISGSEHRRQSR